MDDKTAEKLGRIWETVNTPGWKDLEEDMREKISQIKDALVDPGSGTGDLLRIAQGRILTYNDFLSLYAMLDHVLKEDDESVSADE